jgi:hypothetical protein
MRQLFIMLCLTGLLAGMAYAADIPGTWVGTMDTPMGAMQNTITLALDGTTLSGSVKTDFFEAKIEEAKVNGDNISFVINMDFGKLAYEGIVSGDELKLQVTGSDGGKTPLTAKRQK